MIQKNFTPINVPNRLTKGLKIAIVRTNYYQDLIDNLELYCRKTLRQYGVEKENIHTYVAPGSWEVPLIAQQVARTSKYDAIVAFGVIVKGETYHFDMIANECSRALMRVALKYNLPIALEVLAVHNLDQARSRAGKNNANKGIEGALAVLKTLTTLQTLS